ncbi:MAG: hypothetical protein IJU98_11005 [Synergistaceae bacterium]|nr:hypothetical protein [Synergistaceae bacterium]
MGYYNGDELLRDKIGIITSEQCSLLIDGTLPMEQRNESGLYMVIEPSGVYVACDYSNQASWLDGNGGLPDDPSKMPEGWVEEFRNPIEAIDWLLGASLDELGKEDGHDSEAV